MLTKGIYQSIFKSCNTCKKDSLVGLGKYYFSSLNLNLLSNVISLSEFKNQVTEETKLKDLKEFKYVDNEVYAGGKKVMSKIVSPVFYDITGNSLFSQDTTVYNLCQNDFFVTSQNDSNLIAVLKNDPFDKAQNQTQDQQILNEVCRSMNLTRTDSIIISDYVTRFSQQLLASSYNQVDREFIQMVNKKVLTELSLNSKKKVAIYDALLNILNKKLLRQTEKQKELSESINKKSNSYLKRIFAIAMTKILGLQYCTYVLLSWDIMEPITCLFGIFDLALAYFFWLMTHTEFDYLQMKERYIRKKFLKYENVQLLDSIEDIQSLISYIHQMKSMESPNLQTILDQM